MAAIQNQGDSEGTRTLVTVLLLVFVFPIGLIVMWIWSRWPVWVKLLISLPIVLLVVGFFAVGILSAINPVRSINDAKQMQQLTASPSPSSSIKVKSPSTLR